MALYNTVLGSTSLQQARTEKISLAFRTKILIFSGFKEQLPYMPLLTHEQDQRVSSFDYYSSQIFPSQIISEELSSRSISPEPTSSVADASAAAGLKKQYEILTKEEEKYCASLKWIFEKGKQFDWRFRHRR